eukprot:gene2782-8140_t
MVFVHKHQVLPPTVVIFSIAESPVMEMDVQREVCGNVSLNLQHFLVFVGLVGLHHHLVGLHHHLVGLVGLHHHLVGLVSLHHHLVGLVSLHHHLVCLVSLHHHLVHLVGLHHHLLLPPLSLLPTNHSFSLLPLTGGAPAVTSCQKQQGQLQQL